MRILTLMVVRRRFEAYETSHFPPTESWSERKIEIWLLYCYLAALVSFVSYEMNLGYADCLCPRLRAQKFVILR